MVGSSTSELIIVLIRVGQDPVQPFIDSNAGQTYRILMMLLLARCDAFGHLLELHLLVIWMVHHLLLLLDTNVLLRGLLGCGGSLRMLLLICLVRVKICIQTYLYRFNLV